MGDAGKVSGEWKITEGSCSSRGDWEGEAGQACAVGAGAAHQNTGEAIANPSTWEDKAEDGE